VILGAGYALGVRRLHRRGDRWPAVRTTAFGGAVAVAAVALGPPVGSHDGDVRVHVAQHLAVALPVPLLLALSAPVTLALRTFPRRARRWLLAALHSRPAAVLTHPLLLVVADVAGAYALYLGPLYDLTGRHTWLHVVVHLHMLLTGCALSWVLAGRDPAPRPLRTRDRLVLLVAVAGSHDLLARLMYAESRPQGAGSPGQLHTAAELLAYGGDVIDTPGEDASCTAPPAATACWRATRRGCRRDRPAGSAGAAQGVKTARTQPSCLSLNIW